MPKKSSSSKTQNLDEIRHTAAHVLALAVKKMFPETKFGIGPTIDTGFYYDFDLPRTLKPEDLVQLEKSMKHIIKQNLKMEKIVVPFDKAEAAAKAGGQKYKLELLQEIRSGKREIADPKTPKDSVTFYRVGDFNDLCKGGHVDSTRNIPADALKLTHIAGAYWKGDEKREQLQRVYGALFATKKDLDAHLAMIEEAKKRDHRKLIKDMNLIVFSENVGPGLPLWTPKGTIVRDELENFAKETEKKWGYQRVTTPHLAKRQLFETSGHIPYYVDDLYPGMELDDNEYFLKAMNCPMTMEIYKSKVHSYRELPLRWAEYGTVYRYERSGVLSGLLRARGFTQNDAHIFCTYDQAIDEFVQVMKLHKYYYGKVLGLKDFYVMLSMRDPAQKNKFGGNEEEWRQAEEMIKRAIKKSGVAYKEMVGEASFYGPKADFQIKSATGREETASTNQIDLIMPKRFGLTYAGADGKEHPVAVIHRAPLGSHERFIAFLLEHYAGALPAWLAPVQAMVIPISEKLNKYASAITKILSEENIRVELDDRNESMGKKIREAEIQKIPYMLILGEKEKKSKKVTIRKRGDKKQNTASLTTFFKKLQKEIAEKK